MRAGLFEVVHKLRMIVAGGEEEAKKSGRLVYRIFPSEK